MKSGKQQTVTRHVDDFKPSHVDPKVNDEFSEWCEKTNGSDDLGHVKVVRGKLHVYFGMIIDFTLEYALNIDMKYYTRGMLEELPYNIKETKKTL